MSAQSQSLFRLRLRKLKKHKLAMLGVYTLAVFYFMAIFADFIAPYPYNFETRTKPYHPPTLIYFFDEHGMFNLQPFIYDYEMKFDENYEKIYTPITTKKYKLKFFIKGEPYKFWGLVNCNIHLFGTDAPSKLYLLGSDWNGRDVLSRLIYGGRISLSIGVIGVLLSFTIGMLIGGISGYFGGWVDTVIMRVVEIIMCFPGFYLMLALRAAFPVTLSSTVVYLLIVGIMAFIGWAGLSRVIRGIVLSVREREYIVAAKACGSSSWRIIITHSLPNTFSYAIVAATLSIPEYILGESALSLLGLGINEPQASWGNMLTQAMNLSDMVNYSWILTPGLLIFWTVMAFNLLGDGLRDVFDPKG